MPRGPCTHSVVRFSKKDKLRFGIDDPAPRMSKREPRRRFGHDSEAQTINTRTRQWLEDREFLTQMLNRLRPVARGIPRANRRTASNRVKVQPLVSRSTLPKFYSYDIEPALMPLTERYPAINPEYFHEIYKNRFKVENLCKLSNSYATSCLSTQRPKTVGGSTRVVNVETDAVAEDLQSMIDFWKCLGNYCDILAEIVAIAHPTDEETLRRAFGSYIDKIRSFRSEGHSFESIRSFHFAFHKKRAILGIDDPAGWSNHDLELEQEFLHKDP